MFTQPARIAIIQRLLPTHPNIHTRGTHTQTGHCSPHIPSQWPLLLREYQVGANSVGPYLAALSLADVPRLLLISCCCLLPFFLSGMDALPNATTFLGQFFLLHFLLVAGASSVSYFGTGSTGVPVIGFVIAVTIVTPMILFSGLLYQRSKIAGGLQWLADTSMVRARSE